MKDVVRERPDINESPGAAGSTLHDLVEKLETKDAVIGVFGIGYVGMPLALRFAEVGSHVVGFDVNAEKVTMLRSGQSYIQYISSTRVAAAVERQRLDATTDMRRAREVDALIICVPTPLNRYRQPELRYVVGTIDAIVPYLRPGQVVSLESTTYPGTTDEIIVPRIAAQGLEIGRDIFVVYSPEREDPGNPVFSTHNTPKIIGGVTANCLQTGCSLYRQAIDRMVPVNSTKAAELTKLLENIQRNVNIGLVNEMKIVADSMGIDIFEVIDAASTKPFGFTPYYPGPGIGGHCIPIDPFYLTWKAREFGVHTRFIELAGEINAAMPRHVVDKLVEALNRVEKPLAGAAVLVLGLAYKPNVDDWRDAPAFTIMEMLRAKGAVCAYSDPHVPVFPDESGHDFPLHSIELTAATLKTFDAVMLLTHHRCYDYDLIQRHAALIIDARGRFPKDVPNVVRA